MSDPNTSRTEKAENGQPVTLDREVREEAERTIREVFAVATAKAEAGRSSMPIHISDAALLLGLASVALELIPTTQENR